MGKKKLQNGSHVYFINPFPQEATNYQFICSFCGHIFPSFGMIAKHVPKNEWSKMYDLNKADPENAYAPKSSWCSHWVSRWEYEKRSEEAARIADQSTTMVINQMDDDSVIAYDCLSSCDESSRYGDAGNESRNKEDDRDNEPDEKGLDSDDESDNVPASVHNTDGEDSPPTKKRAKRGASSKNLSTWRSSKRAKKGTQIQSM